VVELVLDELQELPGRLLLAELAQVGDALGRLRVEVIEAGVDESEVRGEAGEPAEHRARQPAEGCADGGASDRRGDAEGAGHVGDGAHHISEGLEDRHSGLDAALNERERHLRDLAQRRAHGLHRGQRLAEGVKERSDERLASRLEHVVELLSKRALLDGGVLRAVRHVGCQHGSVLLHGDLSSSGTLLKQREVSRRLLAGGTEGASVDCRRREVKSELRGEPAAAREPGTHGLGHVRDGPECRV
jgi:hypothetical protein